MNDKTNVDVLAVLERAERHVRTLAHKSNGPHSEASRHKNADDLEQARAAVAELMAASATLLARGIMGLDQSATHDGLKNCDAIANVRYALARVGGAK